MSKRHELSGGAARALFRNTARTHHPANYRAAQGGGMVMRGGLRF